MYLRPMVRFSARSSSPAASSCFFFSASLVAAIRVIEISSGTIGFERSREGELHRAAHLSAIYASAHDRAEGADIEEIVAHELPKLLPLRRPLRVELLVCRGLLVVRPIRDIGLAMLLD